MGAVREAVTYAAFLRQFPRFFATALTLEEARAAVADRLAHREENFLRMFDEWFHGHPSSPYRPLLDLAGCGPADIRPLVHDRGIEGALEELREAGVYYTFEEYKGREPVVRGGREVVVEEWQFDNPSQRHFYRASTSGSTGRPSRIQTGLPHLEILSQHRLLIFDAFGALGQPFSVWRPPLPSGSGINNVLRMSRIGYPADRWFTPLVPGHYRPHWKYRVATMAAVLAARGSGVRLEAPEEVALGDALVIAEYLADTVAREGSAVMSTTVSCALRVALAARDAGIDLAGCRFLIAGEPATAAKVKGIEASGAGWFSDYGAAEMGRVALGCPNAEHHTDLHVTTDTAAIIRHPRRVPGSEEIVPSLHVTSLLPTMPKMLLNLELDDFADMPARSCGCPLEALGLTTHLRGVRSFRKLTGEGVTLVGSDMVDILERVLPERFGGSPLSYQLVEGEDDRGFTRLDLFVSPGVPAADQAILDGLYEALDETSVAAGMARGYWESAGTIRVVREEPRVSARGKQIPLQTTRPG